MSEGAEQIANAHEQDPVMEFCEPDITVSGSFKVGNS